MDNSIILYTENIYEFNKKLIENEFEFLGFEKAGYEKIDWVGEVLEYAMVFQYYDGEIIWFHLYLTNIVFILRNLLDRNEKEIDDLVEKYILIKRGGKINE